MAIASSITANIIITINQPQDLQAITSKDYNLAFLTQDLQVFIINTVKVFITIIIAFTFIITTKITSIIITITTVSYST